MRSVECGMRKEMQADGVDWLAGLLGTPNGEACDGAQFRIPNSAFRI